MTSPHQPAANDVASAPPHCTPLRLGAGGVQLGGEEWTPAPEARVRGLVVLLHGGGQTRHSWRRTAADLATQGWRAAALDARGHGDSGWAPDGDYTMDAFVGDLAAWLNELAPASAPVVLVGASLGGMTCLVGIGEQAVRADGLVLVDIAPHTSAEGVKRITDFMASAPHGFADLDEVAEAVRRYTPGRSRPVNPAGLRKNVRQRADGRWYWHWDPAFLTGGDEPTRTVPQERLSEAARGVREPTLLVRGLHSDVVPASATAQLRRLIPHARTSEVRAGHMIAGDDNDAFSVQLHRFLELEVEGVARTATTPPESPESG